MNQNILLPKLAIPNRYEINLDIDLKNFKYLGKEIVFIEVVEETDEIHLHAVGLTINSSFIEDDNGCLLYTSPSPRDSASSRMPSSA